ncbi:TPA: hypothetical protein ACP5FF_000669 [Escherichia coli]|nr:hypothetical protein [Escherichia coli]
MKQMSLIEMDGFLKGKCIPSDLKVNETNAEYLVRKFGELEGKIAVLDAQLKLSEASERAWETTMMIACGEDGPKSVADRFAALEAKCAALAVESSILNLSRTVLSENILEACNAIASAGFRNKAIMKGFYASTGNGNKYPNPISTMVDEALSELSIPVTDAFMAEVERKAIRKFINSIEHILRDKLSPYDTEEMLDAMRIFLEEQEGEQK